MTTLAIAGLMLLSQPPAGAQAKLDATVAPTGVIAELRSGGELVATDVKVLVVKPAWNGPISPSRVRVPSGNMTTISPRFKRRSDSLIPPSPMPSRSMGIASSELMSQRNGRKTKSDERAR